MINQFHYREDAYMDLSQGVNQLADLIKKAYGPLGSHVIFGNPLSIPISVKSGNGIIQEINLDNPGTELAKESIIKMAETVGDGTSTALILLQKLMNGALQLTMTGISPIKLRKAILAEADRVNTWIEARAQKVTDAKAAVQLVSDGDEEMKDLICRAFEKVTAEGIVTVRDTKGVDSYVEILECLEIDQGYISGEMVTEGTESAAILDYPYILLTDQVITKSEEIAPAMNLARKAGKSLLVMAQDITGEALATLVVNIRNGKLRSVAVKATAYGERRKEILQDIAAITGATVISKDFGDSLQQVTELQLGRSASVKTTGSHTYIYGGGGEPKKVEERIARIRGEICTSLYEVDRVNLKNRLARLSGGVAIIFVGAPTETEMRTRRQSAKSTIAGVKSVLAHGAVEGGGIAFFQAVRELYSKKPKHEGKSEEERGAARIFEEMLTAPLEQLLLNSGISPYEVMEDLNTMPPGYGYDVLKMKYGNMFDLGIADAAATLCRAVDTAASLTGLIITAGAVIREERRL